ncbi:MAG: PstC family ABC transporter permease, partial [Rhodovulum sp.]
MPLFWLVLIVLGLAVAGYVAGRGRALRLAGGDSRVLHSLPSYYGAHVALLTLVPALAILCLWILVQPLVIENRISAKLPDSAIAESSTRALVMSDVRRVAEGLDVAVAAGAMTTDEAAHMRSEFTDVRDRLGAVGVALGSDVGPEVLHAAQAYRSLAARGHLAMTLVVLAAALGGAGLGIVRSRADFRARNVVETAVRYLLIFAATVAILTTIGIVLSLVFNTIEFFKLYPARDFFFGTTWAPSFGGGSELGILPLLWGTFYISLIALAVAVPIGLFAAVYLSEYASSHTRAIAKPLIEVLAGIPTIVYGLFALLTVGPLLMRIFGEGGVGIMQAGTAVMTAGLVMGIMLIPFVSSLSDDIINAVPQSMRDGSLGLGA